MIIQRVDTEHSPESLAARLLDVPGVTLLLSGRHDLEAGRYSLLTADPFLRFVSCGSRCEIRYRRGTMRVQFGNPWQILNAWLSAFELTRERDAPFPLGGCFGYWGYEMGRFADSALSSPRQHITTTNDCHVGFYDSVVAWDHHLAQVHLISTGQRADGSRTMAQAERTRRFWLGHLETAPAPAEMPIQSSPPPSSNMQREGFLDRVRQAQALIHRGDIYQVNLAQRFTTRGALPAWPLFQRLSAGSPAPMAAFYDAGSVKIASSSPELFLKFSGNTVISRPIKGTRPRSANPVRDTQLGFELQTSPKEAAELVMITDLIRNDLGRVCAYGTVRVPELMSLEKYAHVQHLVSTVAGELRSEVTQLQALASCFPGGSITGAPKIRAMQIIDALEPCSRGPYTGALGYLGWNGESQVCVLIRAAVSHGGRTSFHAGAGIVADSDPEAEYHETLAKARGFFDALQQNPPNPQAAIAGKRCE